MSIVLNPITGKLDYVGSSEPGPKGDQGLPGSPGEQGVPGEAGTQGNQGIQGIQGEQGEDSTVPGPKGDKGDQGYQGIQGEQGEDSTVPGPKGDKGDTGNAGAQGDQGNQGIQGIQGSPGDVSGAWPIGAVFISVVVTNPNTLLGFGTWAAFGAGKVMVGLDSGDPNFDVVEETGGAKTVTIAAGNLPQLGVTITDGGHTHLTQRYPTTTGGSSGFTIDTSMSGTLADNTLPTKTAVTGITATANTGGANTAVSVVQPYIVCYFWKRTA